MAKKLISLNIWGNNYLDKALKFLEVEQAEIVCLMEVRKADLPLITRDYPYHTYTANFLNTAGDELGVVIMAKEPLSAVKSYYADDLGEIPIPVSGGATPGTHRPTLVMAEVEGYRIGAVHFTWTPDGYITDPQRADIGRLIEYLRGQELILCGDFNLPRNLPSGNELYDKLAMIYTDNIPSGVMSTIDPHLHRVNKQEAGKLAWMVDYLWSTPQYRVSEVRVEFSVSDHCALVCMIEKN